MAQIHFGVEPIQGLSGLHGVQVFALDVFDERDFENPLVGIILNDGRNFDQARQFGGSQAPFAGDQFVAGTFRANQERLDYPVCFYGVSEFFQARGVEYRAGLQGIWLDVGDRKGGNLWPGLGWFCGVAERL